MNKKVRIKCANCNTINKIPYNEISFRTNKDSRSICRKCCKKIRWEHKILCKKCSDRSFCNGSFVVNAKQFISENEGV
jgi:hypothetical protein